MSTPEAPSQLPPDLVQFLKVAGPAAADLSVALGDGDVSDDRLLNAAAAARDILARLAAFAGPSRPVGVAIKHWDDTESAHGPTFTHQIDDRRSSAGQTLQYIRSRAADQAEADPTAPSVPVLDLMTEINTLAPGGDHYPCVHISDGQDLKFTVFCTPAGLLLRTDDGLPLRPGPAGAGTYLCRHQVQPGVKADKVFMADYFLTTASGATVHVPCTIDSDGQLTCHAPISPDDGTGTVEAQLQWIDPDGQSYVMQMSGDWHRDLEMDGLLDAGLTRILEGYPPEDAAELARDAAAAARP